MAAGVPSAGASDAWGCYRALLERYHRTLDLMSAQGFSDLDEKCTDARAYAAAVERWAAPGVIMDVGSGAGLPGVALAERLPERPLLWVERRRRRAAFLRLVAAECAMGNVRVVDRDVRAFPREVLPAALAVVTAQAVAGFATLYRLTRHLHDGEVLLVARRGERWRDEVTAVAEVAAAEVAVLAAEPLGRGGTLVVVSMAGGPACR